MPTTWPANWSRRRRHRDQALDLQRCLLRLPEDQRAVLLLVSLEDLSYDEVARITGVPVGTVMSRLSRARSRLRELMDEPAAAALPARRCRSRLAAAPEMTNHHGPTGPSP